MSSFVSLMDGQKLLPIIQADSPEQGVEIAKAMKAGGVRLVEVVLRTQASLAALKAIKEALPDMIVGAGTVVCESTLAQAVDAGADFIVTPAITSELAQKLKDTNLPILPGVSNVADILLAKEHGFKELKLFPASLVGGAKFISAMSGLFQDLVFCPTGGVNQDNKDEYLALDNCPAVGGTWVSPKHWVEQAMWQHITDACLVANG